MGTGFQMQLYVPVFPAMLPSKMLHTCALFTILFFLSGSVELFGAPRTASPSEARSPQSIDFAIIGAIVRESGHQYGLSDEATWNVAQHLLLSLVPSKSNWQNYVGGADAVACAQLKGPVSVASRDLFSHRCVRENPCYDGEFTIGTLLRREAKSNSG